MSEGTTSGEVLDYLGQWCPAVAEDLRLYLEQLGGWRRENVLAVLAVVCEQVPSPATCAGEGPVIAAVEGASLCRDASRRQLWAGLLTAVAVGAPDTEHLVHLLRGLSAVQAAVFTHACERARVRLGRTGYVTADRLTVTSQDLQGISGASEARWLDREVDALRARGLVEGRFDPMITRVNLTPTPLALELFARCRGHGGSPVAYYGLA